MSTEERLSITRNDIDYANDEIHEGLSSLIMAQTAIYQKNVKVITKAS